jgi:LuxR family maltose regulon positive regulatory protein
VNYAHSAFALALTFQAQKKLAKTREISEELIAHAVDNNNADMLQVARAFAAELALRQGRLAEASRWVEKYHAKPFLPTYRFYMPQLAAVKILLAQDTTDSRRRAADLLDQLHDFLVSIHNNRFRIDALALQALLHDARGDDTAAVEKLSQALDLAEPSGFIRLFVDLGSQMADLLEQLLQQNVAVDYAGQILSAFNEDAQRVMPGAFHHDQSLDHHISLSSSNSAFPPGHRPLWAGGRIPPSAFPLPPSRTSQPLAEPMTNRELEILNLLGQRLQNKEIAAKLFISPQTVKKHLNNIYVKLNVSSRRQAVEKAGALGILT